MKKTVRTPIAAILFIISIALDLIFNVILWHKPYALISIINLLLTLALSVFLLKKKRDNIPIIILCCYTLLSLISLLLSPSFRGLLRFVANALVAVYALAFCEQTLVKADFSKIKTLATKLSFVPAAIYLITAIGFTREMVTRMQDDYLFRYWDFIDYVTYLPFMIPVILKLLEVIIILTLCAWLKDPYAYHEIDADNDEGQGEAYCSLGKHIVLCLFTCGIWYLIWTYRTTKYLNKAPNAAYYNPTTKLLLCMFIPFYQIYWFYKHGQRIDAMSKFKKLSNSDMATLCLILGIFIPIVACILMQDRINILCTTKAIVEEQKTEDSTTEELKKHKELLDSGVISQEEFDAKKKQLLGL